MRYTLNIQADSAEGLQKALRSTAAKITPADLTPGADVRVGSARVQVAVPQIGTLRQWAKDNGFHVGTRGVISNEVKEAYKEAVRAENREKRAAQKARREARLAAAAAEAPQESEAVPA